MVREGYHPRVCFGHYVSDGGTAISAPKAAGPMKTSRPKMLWKTQDYYSSTVLALYWQISLTTQTGQSGFLALQT